MKRPKRSYPLLALACVALVLAGRLVHRAWAQARRQDDTGIQPAAGVASSNSYTAWLVAGGPVVGVSSSESYASYSGAPVAPPYGNRVYLPLVLRDD